MRHIFFFIVALWTTSITWSCGKNSQTESLGGLTKTNIPSLIDTMPLANTVSKYDTLRVMTYNILYYGDGCQGLPETLDPYFKTIIQYAQPDLLGCVKISAFPLAPGSAGNLADELLTNGLNSAYPGQYSYAPTTNNCNGKGVSVLFFNKRKLTCVKTQTLVSNVTDFDLYKLYYNDINLSITHDTTFLFVVLNHTKSGSPSTTRDLQVTQEMSALRAKFLTFPNLINMGDFNTANSLEAGYQSIISGTDSTTQMSDPPYYPDKLVTYPGNWEIVPNTVSSYLTTSTRMSSSIPNTCGTSGGAKLWFDHILLSPWLISGSNYMKYVKGSYKTIGNDGNRLGIDINNNSQVVNASVPAPVIEALFQFSNKYPVMLKIAVKTNRNAISPSDPIARN
jgi:hypothetical protein